MKKSEALEVVSSLLWGCQKARSNNADLGLSDAIQDAVEKPGWLLRGERADKTLEMLAGVADKRLELRPLVLLNIWTIFNKLAGPHERGMVLVCLSSLGRRYLLSSSPSDLIASEFEAG